MSAEAAIYNFDMASFYSKFERDIRLGQYDTGSISGGIAPLLGLQPGGSHLCHGVRGVPLAGQPLL